MSDTTIKELLEAGVHFGHQTSFWNPKMSPYIYGNRNHIHIIDIQKTIPMLKDACNYAEKIVSKGGNILFVGTKRAARDSIYNHASDCGMPYVNHRWLGGMLTNFNTVRQSIKRLKDLEVQVTRKDTGLTKKELLLMDRELGKLNASLGGIKDMKSLPSAIFIIDVGYENIAVGEAKKLGIPIIAVVDTNNSFDDIDYYFPGNYDAMRAIDLYCSSISNSIKKGLEFAKTNSPIPIEEELQKRAEKDQGTDKVHVKKKKVTKKIVKEDEEPNIQSKENLDETTSDEEEVNSTASDNETIDKKKKVITKKVTKKKSTVTKKTVTTKKVTAKKTVKKKVKKTTTKAVTKKKTK